MTEPDSTIRPARLEDLEKLVEFNRRLALETEDHVLDPAVLTPGVQRLLGDPALGFYTVAEVGGEVVGQLMITFEWSDWRNGRIWWFQSVYVAAEHRRRGIFRRLASEILERARRDPEVVGLRLYVEKGNDRARNAYREFGIVDAAYDVMERIPLDPGGGEA